MHNETVETLIGAVVIVIAVAFVISPIRPPAPGWAATS